MSYVAQEIFRSKREDSAPSMFKGGESQHCCKTMQFEVRDREWRTRENVDKYTSSGEETQRRKRGCNMEERRRKSEL